MSNIEDDVKAKGFIEGYKQIKNNAIFIKSIDKDFFFELVDYLLSEREQYKERIKELEEENQKTKKFSEELDNEVCERVKQCHNMQTDIDRLYLDKEELEKAYFHEKLAKEEVEELLECSISKQKVKDKIKEIKHLKSRTITNEGYNIMQGEIIVLQELLEEGE